LTKEEDKEKDVEIEVDFDVVKSSSENNSQEPILPSKKRGRPRKYHSYEMTNGVIDAKKIFLYVPAISLPLEEIDRFLTMCDLLIKELGPKIVSQTDVKDIATLYRDTIVRDAMYIVIAECKGAADKSTITDVEKISKQIDTTQKSLKVRAADRQEDRKNNKDLSMVDIVDKYIDDEGLFAMFEAQQNMLLEKYYDNPHTDVDEYMTLRTATELPVITRSKKDSDV